MDRLELKNRWQEIPKSELHVHLRGAAPIEVFAELLNKYAAGEILQEIPFWEKISFRRCENIRPFLSPRRWSESYPVQREAAGFVFKEQIERFGGFSERRWSVDTISDLFRYRSFSQFLTTYYFTRYFIRDASDLRRLITGVLEKLKSQNVVYAEITISVGDYVKRGISLADIKTCLEETIGYPGIRVQWIVDLVRNSGAKAAHRLLEEIIELQCENIVGITLGGSEHLFPPKRFSRVYAEAREHGLRLTIHAGEALGPRSIWDALRILGVERIGHGVRAVEDEALVHYLAEKRIPLEVCLTSNVRTGIIASYEAHPVRRLHEAGVPITINSDDPTFFGTTLADEYAHISALGVQDDDIFRMIKNGFTYAFLPKNEIEGYLENLEQEWNKRFTKAPCAER